MGNFYPYLISSFPMLSFGASVPLSSADFFGKCADFMSERDLDALRCAFVDEPSGDLNPVVAKWLRFNISLKNELVKARSVRKKWNAERYLRPDGNSDMSFYHLAMAAHRNPCPLEGEKILDFARWNFLEDLSLGHYFDVDLMIIYAYKLMILERWEKINAADSEALLRSV